MNKSIQPKKFTFITEEQTRNTVQNIIIGTVKRERAYGDVTRCIDNIKHFILSSTLYKPDDRIKGLSKLSAELAKAERAFETLLLQNDWQSLTFEPNPDVMPLFKESIAAIQQGIDLVIENPERLDELRAEIRETMLDRDFLDILDNAKKRDRPPDRETRLMVKRMKELIGDGLAPGSAIAKVAAEMSQSKSAVSNAWYRYK